MEKQGKRLLRVVLVPGPFQGHINPTLQLGSILHSNGFSITVVHAQYNSPDPSSHPDFRFLPLPDTPSALTGEFIGFALQLNTDCKARFQECLAEVMRQQGPDDRIACIIHDQLMYFAGAVAEDLKLPSIVLRTGCVATSLARDALFQLKAEGHIPFPVIYVSLGSLAFMDVKELVEMAWGLANNHQPFLWVVRPGSICGAQWIEVMPEGLKQKIGERGYIVKWAPQKEVLAHSAVRGFLSHCGWNSTLESICEGIPMICKPCFGDQGVNARYVSHIWRVGLELESELERSEIERAVRRLMVDEEGKKMRKTCKNLKESIELCIREGGSSNNYLNELIKMIMSF